MQSHNNSCKYSIKVFKVVSMGPSRKAVDTCPVTTYVITIDRLTATTFHVSILIMRLFCKFCNAVKAIAFQTRSSWRIWTRSLAGQLWKPRQAFLSKETQSISSAQSQKISTTKTSKTFFAVYVPRRRSSPSSNPTRPYFWKPCRPELVVRHGQWASVRPTRILMMIINLINYII